MSKINNISLVINRVSQFFWAYIPLFLEMALVMLTIKSVQENHSAWNTMPGKQDTQEKELPFIFNIFHLLPFKPLLFFHLSALTLLHEVPAPLLPTKITIIGIPHI